MCLINYVRRGGALPLVSLLLLCLLCCALAATTRAWRSPAAIAQGPANPAAQNQAATPPLEVELITFRPSGPDPTELKRPPGPFILLVENLSGEDLGTLRLDPELDHLPPQALAQAQMARERFDWTQPLDLPPGTYTLRRADSSSQSCRIIIDPNLAAGH